MLRNLAVRAARAAPSVRAARMFASGPAPVPGDRPDYRYGADTNYTMSDMDDDKDENEEKDEKETSWERSRSDGEN